MPAPVREQIMAALATRLAQLAGVTVRRNPSKDAEALPTVDLYDTGTQTPGQAGGGIEEFHLQVPIDLFAADGTALNLLEAQAWAKISEDIGLGGIALDILRGEQEEGALDRRQGHPKSIGRPMPIVIQYWTREGDPYNPGPS